MRTLLLTDRYPPDIGGVGRSASRIANALSDLGHDVHVLTFTRQLPPGRAERSQETAGGPTLHRLGQFAASDTTLQMAGHLIDHLHATAGLELVWGHYLHPAGFAAVLHARRHDLPVIVSARGNDVDRLLYPPGDFARLQFTLQNADLVAAVSRDLADKIASVLPRGADCATNGEAVAVLPNVVDAEVFRPGPPAPGLRRRLGITDDEAVLCFSGELRFKKGIEFLLAALAQVVQRRPACLLVIGQARPEDQPRLTEFAAQFPAAAARVLFTGHLEDPAAVAEHLRLADVFLQPSLWDGMPNALLEAMASGLPCIASTAGAMPEVVEHGEHGVLLPVHALDRLADAILELLAQPPAVRTAIGAAARTRVLAAFAPEHERDQLQRLLAEVSARRRARR